MQRKRTTLPGHHCDGRNERGGTADVACCAATRRAARRAETQKMTKKKERKETTTAEEETGRNKVRGRPSKRTERDRERWKEMKSGWKKRNLAQQLLGCATLLRPLADGVAQAVVSRVLCPAGASIGAALFRHATGKGRRSHTRTHMRKNEEKESKSKAAKADKGRLCVRKCI